jgi:glycosyltransferase involved in cell wall biosynthesis
LDLAELEHRDAAYPVIITVRGTKPRTTDATLPRQRRTAGECDRGGAPLVSIVMTFRDAERFIAESIESVTNLLFGSWELILVDDGSSDCSTAVAMRAADELSARIRYLRHDGHLNLGMSASRNLALAEARAEYIAFLDADDVWLPDALDERVRLLESCPAAAMVYGPTEWWSSWRGDLPEPRDFKDRVADAFPSGVCISGFDVFASYLRDGGLVPCMCSVLVRREAALRAGGFENAFREMFEDQAFYARLLLGNDVVLTHESGARYRQHARSCCALAEADGSAVTSRIRFMQWLSRYLTEKQIESPYLAELVAWNLHQCR